MDDVKTITYAAPSALVTHCRRVKKANTSAAFIGTRDAGDVAALIMWLNERGEFSDHDSWVNLGMSLRVDFGDSGLDLWRLAHDSTVTEGVEASKWNSFATDPQPGCVTLASIMKRAHAAGWRGTVRKSSAAMFDGVAQIAAAAGASLPNSGMIPLSNTAAIVEDLGRPTVESFIAANAGQPATNSPLIPDSAALFDSLNSAVAILLGAMERTPRAFRASAAVDMLAVLSMSHGPTFTDVCTRIRAAGAALPESKLSAAVARFEAQVSRTIRTAAGFKTDAKGNPESSNTDNVAVGIRTIGAGLRFNEWTNRTEIQWSDVDEWKPLQEKDFDRVVVTFGNGQYNFRPPENMLKRTLNFLAREDAFDPVVQRLAAAQAAWDGVSRLDGWLTHALGVPNDALHAAIGRNLLGGICKRIRRPGCKHDEVVILMGPEDTFKSTFCRALAMDDAWFTDSVDFSGSPQNTIPQLFGRVVVELAELDGMERREVQHIKRFLSAQTDNVTLKYEAYTSDHARRCIFIGTSNESNPLRGDAGNRRFLPVHVEKRIDIDYVRDNLEQLIGEAATLEAAGDLFLIPKDVLPEMRARQESVRAQADFEVYLHGWFTDKTHPGYIMPHDLAALLKDATGRSVPPNQYGKTMQRLGFESKPTRLESKTERVWCRGGMTGSARYGVQRDANGRLSPRQMFAGVVVPMKPAAP